MSLMINWLNVILYFTPTKMLSLRKDFKKIGIEFILLFILISFIIYFFLGVSYKAGLFTKISISLLSFILIYLSYKQSLYEFSLVILTGFSVFLSIGISFKPNVWLNLVISLIFIFLFWISYKKFKIKYELLLLYLFIVVWIILGFNVKYRQDWIMENLLTIPFVILIFVLYKWFRLSNISYTLIFIFMFLHIIGSHYTYAEVPFGDWMKTFFGFDRNHYDRIVHFCFGLLLAYPLREVGMRIGNLKGIWALYIPVEFVLAFSCIYELIEWGIAVFFGGDLGVAYLGTQGDVWDAQKDMFNAGVGSIIAMFVTYLIISYYNSSNYRKELKESLKIKSKSPLGENVLLKWISNKHKIKNH